MLFVVIHVCGKRKPLIDITQLQEPFYVMHLNIIYYYIFFFNWDCHLILLLNDLTSSTVNVCILCSQTVNHICTMHVYI